MEITYHRTPIMDHHGRDAWIWKRLAGPILEYRASVSPPIWIGPERAQPRWGSLEDAEAWLDEQLGSRPALTYVWETYETYTIDDLPVEDRPRFRRVLAAEQRA